MSGWAGGWDPGWGAGDPGGSFPAGFDGGFASLDPAVAGVTPFAARVYASLPDHHRADDETQPGPNTLPLLRYIRALASMADPAETLVDRLLFVRPEDGGPPAGTSDLADPATADLTWLPWLSQLVGVDLDQVDGDQARRDAIRSASSGFKAGTRTAVEDAARSALTGSKYVRVTPHRTATGAGQWYDVRITTRTSETPDVAAVLAAVVAKQAKPAGVRLWHQVLETTWDAVEAAYTTWDGWDAVPTWTAFEETSL